MYILHILCGFSSRFRSCAAEAVNGALFPRRQCPALKRKPGRARAANRPRQSRMAPGKLSATRTSAPMDRPSRQFPGSAARHR
ncbi:hypothetical protein MAPG_07300 [Magnaporthiopsis poae ATCC 64411]|uniref:Uncharacterized protein n=1 Tax=Magnaporthiopsis poae (strain ATCC 64411 / 73-15) TaxID=644358 RepID=A0A0C4E4A8_MAGP6|nr:hypothetical protein MAPG_07300 [Magnaporthiopsis poae ATCC 64411]